MLSEMSEDIEQDAKGVPLGMGCGECGFTGKRRTVMDIPLAELGATEVERKRNCYQRYV
jgi:hypothetical protein